LGLSVDQALAIYNKYIMPTETGKYFANLNFVFEDLPIFDINILDGNDNVKWTKKIAIGSDKIAYITKNFLENGPKGTFTLPVKTNNAKDTWEFTNTWIINNDSDNPVDCSNTNPVGWPILNIQDCNSHITLTPVFTRTTTKHIISFVNPFDDNFIINIEAEYGTLMQNILPKEIPYKNDSLLDFNQTYGFVGYNTSEGATAGIEFTSNDKVTGPQTYYAIFNEVSVYDNIHLEYFTYTDSHYTDPVDDHFDIEEGYAIKPISGLKGKITIPAEYNDLPICQIAANAFLGNSDITHIFFAKNNKVRILDEYAFAQCSALKYFEFTDALRIIDNHVFYNGAPLAPLDNCYNFGKNLYSLGTFAFNQSLYFTKPVTIILPHTLERLGSYALSNFK
jgi:hypothetical protein